MLTTHPGRRRLVPLLILVGLQLGLSACAGAPRPNPQMAVTSVPDHLRSVRVHVRNVTRQRSEADGEESVTGFTHLARALFQKTLAEAGYIVVVDPSRPYDVEVVIDTDYLTSIRGGTAERTMVGVTLLSEDGVELDQLSGMFTYGENTNEENNARRLVARLNQSQRLARYHRERQDARYRALDDNQAPTTPPALTVAAKTPTLPISGPSTRPSGSQEPNGPLTTLPAPNHPMLISP